jgi:adenylylsulfate kinase
VASPRSGVERTTIWLTGRPCSGKTTVAAALAARLRSRGIRTTLLDGDVVRKGLSSDLGFSDADRRENLRRVAHVAQLFNDNGQCVIAAFVSPTEELRRMVRGIIRNFRLCYLRCSPETCEKRDVKGMYGRARSGKIPQFTGVSAPFEEPRQPDVVLDTERNDVETCVAQVLEALELTGREPAASPSKS